MKICEIFPSFDGEVNYFGQGTPSVFVRLQGCNLRCSWCDTPYAQDSEKGETLSMITVFSKIISYPGFRKVTITGGEPLLQLKNLSELVHYLKRTDFSITIETNGSMELSIPRSGHEVETGIISYVVDYKLPSSGMMDKMLPLFYFKSNLQKSDFVKFVIQDYDDFQKAISIQLNLGKNTDTRFAYSPVHNQLSPKELAEWLIKSSPNILEKCILNVQLHKIIWPGETKR